MSQEIATFFDGVLTGVGVWRVGFSVGLPFGLSSFGPRVASLDNRGPGVVGRLIGLGA
jgi:hypothetical protein